jgi:hypothetical protein
MRCICTVGLEVLCGVLGMSMLYGGDFATYRGFQFGSSLSTVAKQAAMDPSQARLVHQRPALIQELEWRHGWFNQPQPPVESDPVDNGLLYFYDGELFRIVVTYDRDKVAGMTEEDMIGAISLTYGVATRPAVEIAYQSNYGETAQVLARWEDSEYSYNLVKAGNRLSYALVLYSKRVDALAQTAIAEAIRLDKIEAPQRAIELRKQQETDGRLALEKARSVNLPNFRP